MSIGTVKKQKAQKSVSEKNIRFENYKNCSEATEIKKKTNHLEKNKTNIDSPTKNHEEFIISNKSILKTQQRFKSEMHNVFTEEINKIALSSNDNKIMQSIDSIETHAYGTNKHLVSENEEY